MKLLTYTYENKETIGILSKDEKKVIPIKNILGEKAPTTMLELVKAFTDDILNKLSETISEEGIDIEKIKVNAPIPEPLRGVICLGKNYIDHVNEVPSAMDLKKGLPENPIYFCKLVDRALGMNEIIPSYEDLTDSLDYEVELGVIIGKEGKNIPKEKAEEYIFGYTIINDISVRNIQTKHVQWFRGKSFDGTCPIGPYIVHKSEIPYPPNLDIKCYINDELRQNSNTNKLIFDIPTIISEFSKGITLKPGDIISTGTPSGVGMGFKPEKFLKSGDIVKCEIEKIGELVNIVK